MKDGGRDDGGGDYDYESLMALKTKELESTNRAVRNQALKSIKSTFLSKVRLA